MTLSGLETYLNVNPPEWISHHCLAKSLPIVFPMKWSNNEEKDWNVSCKCKCYKVHIFWIHDDNVFSSVAGHPLLQTGSKVLTAFIQDPNFSRDTYNYWEKDPFHTHIFTWPSINIILATIPILFYPPTRKIHMYNYLAFLFLLSCWIQYTLYKRERYFNDVSVWLQDL